MPTFKLISKERVGSKIKKKHEVPKTPYERILESSCVSEEQKKKLTETYQSLDPFELKIQIEEKLKLFLEAIRTKEKQGEELKLTA